MNTTFKSLLMFAAGTVFGAIVTYEAVKTGFENRSDREIESVKERYKEKMGDIENRSRESQQMYEDAVNALNKYSGYCEEKNNKEEAGVDAIHVISPDDFSEIDDYTVRSLTYWTDGVVTDENGNEVDIDNTIGKDSLEHFGEYEEDCVYVRNDDICTDFEILRDYRAYSDIC